MKYGQTFFDVGRSLQQKTELASQPVVHENVDAKKMKQLTVGMAANDLGTHTGLWDMGSFNTLARGWGIK